MGTKNTCASVSPRLKQKDALDVRVRHDAGCGVHACYFFFFRRVWRSCTTARTGRRPHWSQAALVAGRTGRRPHWSQAALGAGRTGCRPHWVQAVLGALHQHWVEWRGRVTREVFLRPTGRCSGQCQPERGRRVSPTGRSLSQRDGVCPNGTEFVPTGRSLSQRDGVCPNGTVCSGLVWSGQVWSNGSLAVYV